MASLWKTLSLQNERRGALWTLGMTFFHLKQLNSVLWCPTSPQYWKMAVRVIQLSPSPRPVIPFLLECVISSRAHVCHGGQMAEALVCVPRAVCGLRQGQGSLGKGHLRCHSRGLMGPVYMLAALCFLWGSGHKILSASKERPTRDGYWSTFHPKQSLWVCRFFFPCHWKVMAS